MRLKKIRKLGVVGVDSGQLLITDPCYLASWKNDEYNEDQDKPEYSYSGACHVTLSENRGGELGEEIFTGRRNQLGIAFRTQYGDGAYPVYLHKGTNGYEYIVIRIG